MEKYSPVCLGTWDHLDSISRPKHWLFGLKFFRYFQALSPSPWNERLSHYGGVIRLQSEKLIETENRVES